jgi:hypothetical protein
VCVARDGWTDGWMKEGQEAGGDWDPQVLSKLESWIPLRVHRRQRLTYGHRIFRPTRLPKGTRPGRCSTVSVTVNVTPTHFSQYLLKASSWPTMGHRPSSVCPAFAGSCQLNVSARSFQAQRDTLHQGRIRREAPRLGEPDDGLGLARPPSLAKGCFASVVTDR